MTDSDVQAVTWTPVGAPFSRYEVTRRGQVRSVDHHDALGRLHAGTILKQRRDSRRAPRKGYWRVNVTDDTGRKRPGTYVHTLQWLAFEGELPGLGMQIRHYDDDPDHNWWAPGGEANCGPGKPGNLVKGNAKQQWTDKVRNGQSPLPSPRWSRRVRKSVAARLRGAGVTHVARGGPPALSRFAAVPSGAVRGWDILGHTGQPIVTIRDTRRPSGGDVR